MKKWKRQIETLWRLTFLLQKTNWNTSWWYPQWLSGVSSSFSVSPSVVHNCCRKCLLKRWIFVFVDIWEGMGAQSARLNGWIERGEKLRSWHEDLLVIVMSGFLELQYAPVLKCNVLIIWGENFLYPRVISNCF